EEIISDSNVNVEKKGEGREGLIGKRNEKESGINCDNEGSIEEKEKGIESLNDGKNLGDEEIREGGCNENVENGLNIGKNKT
ncbi:DUF1542 domain-containing protein, partial [Staphylococcus epidermidis]|uniref:DUF1542 domain-containing protein n=1 Tax=Staphylococcus epidermidis TaxID=1282 RepID=UPI001642B65C